MPVVRIAQFILLDGCLLMSVACFMQGGMLCQWNDVSNGLVSATIKSSSQILPQAVAVITA